MLPAGFFAESALEVSVLLSVGFTSDGFVLFFSLHEAVPVITAAEAMRAESALPKLFIKNSPFRKLLKCSHIYIIILV